jgi:hypothetical protein
MQNASSGRPGWFNIVLEKHLPMPKLSRGQKRRKKLAEGQRRSREHTALVCDASSHKTSQLAPLWLTTETGIAQAYVSTDRQLTDDAVFSALEALIGKVRSGALSWEGEAGKVVYQNGGEDDPVIERIRRHWIVGFAGEQPPRDDWIGALGSMSGTIREMKSRNPNSRSHLRYLSEFLVGEAGLEVQTLQPEKDDASPDPSKPC